MTYSDNGSNNQTGKRAAAGDGLVWLLYSLLGMVIFESALVLLGNTLGDAVWLLVLLAAGIGQGLLLPSKYAWFGGLAMVVLWVMARQALGIWTQSQLVQSMLEVAGLLVAVILTIRFRQGWERMHADLAELRSLRDVLVAGEGGTGLLPWEVAELRLKEEVDRARQFHRPVGLLLVQIETLPQAQMDGVEPAEIQQALIRQLVSASLVHDVPFRVHDSQVGVILPERDWASLYRDADLVVDALKQGTFLDRSGQPCSVVRYVRLDFGLGTYQGERAGDIDLMRAARDSLSVSQDLADIGVTSVTAHAMPATPIVESGPRSTEEVE